jgi:CRP-like cAMP-binding protein
MGMLAAMRKDVGSAALSALAERLSRHTRLSAAAVSALRDVAQTQRVTDAGQIVAREAERPGECLLVAAGFAMRHKIVSGGRRQILSIDMAGDFIGLDLLFVDVADSNVQALSNCTLVALQKDALRALLDEHPVLARALGVELVHEAAISRAWLASLGARDPRTRVSHLLCEIGYRLERAGIGSRHKYELPITQEQLADTVGLSLIHVTRTLKALEAEGLIARARRSIKVHDIARLCSAGDFNARYLELGA